MMKNTKCKRCGELEIPPKHEWDCEHYNSGICCLCALDEEDDALLQSL